VTIKLLAQQECSLRKSHVVCTFITHLGLQAAIGSENILEYILPHVGVYCAEGVVEQEDLRWGGKT